MAEKLTLRLDGFDADDKDIAELERLLGRSLEVGADEEVTVSLSAPQARAFKEFREERFAADFDGVNLLQN